MNIKELREIQANATEGYNIPAKQALELIAALEAYAAVVALIFSSLNEEQIDLMSDEQLGLLNELGDEGVFG